MTLSELIRAMRINLSAEEDATSLYMAHADATDNELAKKVLIDIANEERVHVGEFQRLISFSRPTRMHSSKTARARSTPTPRSSPAARPLPKRPPQAPHSDMNVPSVGSLRGK